MSIINSDRTYFYDLIIPECCNDLIDSKSNIYLNNAFNKQMYYSICTLSSKYLNKIYEDYSLAFDHNDALITFMMSYDNIFNYYTDFSYDDDTIPFMITFDKNGLLCQFIEPLSMINKLSTSKIRYVSYEVILNVYDKYNKKYAHSLLLLFDKTCKCMYVIDSCGTIDFLDKYVKYVYHCKNVESVLNSVFSRYAALINYIYEDSHNIFMGINVKIKSISQQKFFNGYCRAWSLFFQYIFSKVSDNFKTIKYLHNFSDYDLTYLNEIIEIFQVYIYHKYIKNNIPENIIFDSSTDDDIDNITNDNYG